MLLLQKSPRRKKKFWRKDETELLIKCVDKIKGSELSVTKKQWKKMQKPCEQQKKKFTKMEKTVSQLNKKGAALEEIAGDIEDKYGIPENTSYS